MHELDWPLCVPVLSDGVVTLRAHTEADLAAMLEMSQDRLMTFWTSVPDPATLADTRQFAFEVVPAGWRDGSNRVWAIEAVDPATGQGRYCGNVDLRGERLAEIGFALHPWARGRGWAARAVRLAIDWGFTRGGIVEVSWKSLVGNIASWRVAQACGFTFYGTVPGGMRHHGSAADAWLAVARRPAHETGHNDDTR